MSHDEDSGQSETSQFSTRSPSFQQVPIITYMDDDDGLSLSEENTHATEFTHSSAWYVRNALNIHRRCYFAHFEKGLFLTSDLDLDPKAPLHKPFLPQKSMYLIENLRLAPFPPRDMEWRCLHFPVSSQELQNLLSAIRNIKYKEIPTNSQLIFAFRTIRHHMLGRNSFDIARLCQENARNDFKSVSNVALFAAPLNTTGRVSKMSQCTSIISDEYQKQRVIEFHGSTLMVSNGDQLSIFDVTKKSKSVLGIDNIQRIKYHNDGDYFIAKSTGNVKIVSISGDNWVEKSDFELPIQIDDFKISSTITKSYGALDPTKKTFVFGCQGKMHVFNFDDPIIDYCVLNSFSFVASKYCIKYLNRGSEITSWSAPEEPVRLNIHSQNKIISCCTRNNCFLIDARSPRTIGLVHSKIAQENSDFQISSFLDIGVLTTNKGLFSVDVRCPERLLSSIIFENDLPISGGWIPQSRLYTATQADKFVVLSPYLNNPYLEGYQIPLDKVLKMYPGINCTLIHQDHQLTLMGGFGQKVFIPKFV